MLSLRLRAPGRAKAVEQALLARGIVIDEREPDTLRLAAVPLFTTFHDIWRFVTALREVAA